MVERSQIEVKIVWAKVGLRNKIKRIAQPSQDLEKFIGQVKARFDEVSDAEYLFAPDGSRKEIKGDGKAFSLMWHSQSPTQESALDMTANAVEVVSSEQFFEILCTHAIIDRSTKKTSVPRFTICVYSAGEVQPVGDILGQISLVSSIDMSPIRRKESVPV